MPSSWSKVEVDLTIAEYLAMLSEELRGNRFNKSEHRRKLIPLLSGRTEGSIERKHQNISAVLIQLGYPYIRGYKPLGNFQALLLERVIYSLSVQPNISEVVMASVDQPIEVRKVDNILNCLEEPPASSDWVYPSVRETGKRSRHSMKYNYLEREARNSSLGLAGERFVFGFEQARLVSLGLKDLANRIEHVSITLGDGLGFDIRSFEPDGADRLIEVKTTAGGKQTPFFISRNELEVSQEENDSYHLYRVFEFRCNPRLFSVAGALNRVCKLEAVQYSARF